MLLPLFACGLLAGCQVGDDTDAAEAPVTQAPAAPAPPAAPPAPETTGLRFIVDISDRQLYVLDGQDTLRREPVAVGMEDHPTPTGSWTIDRVDWNPDWTPPPGEDWTEDKEKQPPGSPENPMGRARLIFNPPYSIHGTKDRASLGTNESHGSIRVANEAVKVLGRMVMEKGGATKPESFFTDVESNRKEMQQVPIPRPVPITIRD